MEHIIEKYALDNALKYNGKANPGSIIGSVIKERPAVKKDMKKLKELVVKTVQEVNSMNLEEQEQRLKEIAPEMLELEEKPERDIFSSVPVKGKVKSAFPPEPSKYPHIGHAKSIVVNYEFAKRNKGEFILRFEDTNPELAKKEFYDIHLENYEWLGIKPDKVIYVSDYLEEFYKYAEKLIEKGLAYVCRSSQEDIREMRMKCKPVKDRENSAKENIKLWKEMMNAEQGSMVLLAKIDLNHKNSVMRDPTLFRIIDHPHCRTGNKYRVWPNYDFENSVMDGTQGITHRFRTKEFELRSELQRYLQKQLELPETYTYEFARFNLEGVESSGRVIREKVQSRELLGWDDPSLTTLVALRRRGFQPEPIREFVLNNGITKSEATLTWDDLIIHNKRYLDEKANRYSFIEDPVKITIEGAPELEVELNLHPEHRKGGRKFKTSQEFYLSKKDCEARDGLYRLMECLNFEKKGDKFTFHSTDYKEYKGQGKGVINFLPVQEGLVECIVMMPDKKKAKGLAEPGIKNIDEGDVIQFERFGFCRLDCKDSFEFWYTHG